MSACSPLTEALDKLSVCDVWEILGLHGTPKPSCRSPFRDDRNASFSIYDGGRRWKDHAIGEGGDAADFVAKACNLSKQDGARRLIELAGTARKTNNSQGNYKNARRDSAPGQKHDPFEKDRTAKRKNWPVFEAPTPAEIETIAELRALSVEGVSLAVQRGLLYCADSHEGRAWILSDCSRVNAQARRIDGKPWQRKAGAKAWTLPGSIASWPVGLPEATHFPAIVLVEGAPDLLASLHLAWCDTATPETRASGKGVDIVANLGVVAMLGAANWLPQNALPHFANKRIRIFQHEDDSGQKAAARWATQLQAAGANVDGYAFSGFIQVNETAVADFNDFIRIHPINGNPSAM